MGIPFFWRWINNQPIFISDEQRNLELCLIMPKFFFIMLNNALQMFSISTMHRKMYLKQTMLKLIDPHQPISFKLDENLP